MEQFDSFVCNDLGTPRALSVLWGVLKDDAVSNADKRYVVNYMDSVLGLKLSEVKAKKDEPLDCPAQVMELVGKRAQAKKDKDWALADTYRNQIDALGYVVKDTPAGPVVSKKM